MAKPGQRKSQCANPKQKREKLCLKRDKLCLKQEKLCLESKGECSKCGKRGHRREECGGGIPKTDIQCFICGSPEYKAAACDKGWAEEGRNESALLSRQFYPPAKKTALTALSVCKDTGDSSGDGNETWTADSGATSNVAPSGKELRKYQPVTAGTSVKVADGNSLPAASSGLLEIKAEQPEGPTSIPLRRVLHVPRMERSLISECQLALMTAQLSSKSPWRAHVGIGEVVCYFCDFNESSELD